MCCCGCAPDPEIIICLCTKPLWNRFLNQNNITWKHMWKRWRFKRQTTRNNAKEQQSDRHEHSNEPLLLPQGGEHRQHKQIIPNTLGLWYCVKACFCDCAPDPEICDYCFCQAVVYLKGGERVQTKTTHTKNNRVVNTALKLVSAIAPPTLKYYLFFANACFCLKGGEQGQTTTTHTKNTRVLNTVFKLVSAIAPRTPKS